ncbi:MAG: alpha-amylase family glycosyl hydrolase [Sediminibacterium sp.]|nr:alpha-amylase family glycosyl hydrolase [Sediminibacterium sp.]
MKLRFSLLLMGLCIAWSAISNTYRLFPENWWVGMKWNQVQVIIRNQESGIGQANVQLQYPGVRIQKVHRFSNANYVAVDLLIAPTAQPGKVPIRITQNGKTEKVDFVLKPRRKGNGTLFAQGVNSADLMYLIMPDRFANGDESNDRIPGMLDQTLNRDTVFNRHGGDLQGITQNLSYFNKMGVTALWLNPVLINDMKDRTEHGYAFTDHYRIDPRLGGEDAYHQLIQSAHAKGLKIIQDAVYNHVGTQHILFKDQPDSSWFNRWPSFTQTSYKDQVLFDPYASEKDKKIMSDGWFVRAMPDWNHRNKHVEIFLIQHAIWTVEEFGIDGWRIDTYAYNDLEFMNRCNAALYKEYPKLTLFGETWVHGVVNQAFFCENNLQIPFKSNLQATTDFQTLLYGIQPALNEPFGWTEGVNKLYITLTQDLLYKDPMQQVIFLDNHDIPRFYSVVGKDLKKYKMAMAWLMTCRGIPQLYYGNEVLMEGFTSPNDGYVRKDFPGGWKGDQKNAFTGSGLTAEEKDMQDYIAKLAHFRKQSTAITRGKMLQFVPKDGLYVYFRYDNNQVLMCVMNTSAKDMNVQFSDYAEMTKNFQKGTDIISNEQIGTVFSIPAMTMKVIELKK